MMDTIAHRGPDDSGCYLRGNIGLGSRRLSIIDLDTGNVLWSVEHHFTPYTMINNPAQFLAYFAGCTERIDMGKELERAGCKDVKLTVYPDAGHDSWTQAYNEPEIWNWFLAHQRKP